MGVSELAEDVFANALVSSCDTSIARSTEDGMDIVRLDENQVMVSEILSALVALIHTV